ncbi:MAG: Transcriptional regulatory protein ZraR [Pseudomonadota bacterium]|jgi:DNA-binding NarL/FixJ family response regulator
MSSVPSISGDRRPRVLLTDEQPAYLAEMTEILRGAGYDCDCAADAHEVVGELNAGAVDLLVADIRIPGNFDLELVGHVRGLAEPPAVILTTAFPTLQTAIQSVKLRVSAYLVKPFGFGELLTEVQEALAARESEAAGHPSGAPLSGPMVVRASTALAEDHPEVRNLTRREYEVLVRVLTGDDVPSIGGSLFISPHTVRNHLKAIYRKLKVRSRVELVVRLGPLTRAHQEEAARA